MNIKGIYNSIGILLCSCAGGGMALATLGAQFVLPGLLLGTIVGFMLSKAFVTQFLKRTN